MIERQSYSRQSTTSFYVPSITCQLLLPLTFICALASYGYGQSANPSQASAPKGESLASVLTQHNDNWRTGANLKETALDTSNVNSRQFGKVFSRAVDGQIYAQPLYVPNVRLANGFVHNIVYVATMHNTVYAFDADDPNQPEPLWYVNLGRSVPYNYMHMEWTMFGKYNYNIKPEIGITSTPVIDEDKGTIYLTSKECERPTPKRCRARDVTYKLHALDIRNGHEQKDSPVTISATVRGHGAGAKCNGTLRFKPSLQLQRPGLLLLNGKVYLAFASHQDTGKFHGWIMAYDAATLKQTAVYCTSPNGLGAGIWQAGNGLAGDEDGNIYVMTGNGSFEEAGLDKGNSFLKFDPNLALLDFFTPANYSCMNAFDIDLGSAGVLLLPQTELMVGGGKEGVIYVVDRKNMGKLQPDVAQGHPHWHPCISKSGISPPVQSFQAAALWEFDPHHPLPVFGYHHIHGAPVYWASPTDGPLIFIWPERDYLRAFRLDVSTSRFTPVAQPDEPPTSLYRSTFQDSPRGMPGAMLSISSNGNTPGTAILWASMPLDDDALTNTVPGILRAFDASNISVELWNSMQNPVRDDLGKFAKYCPPTIANGKVYMATFSNELMVYGELQATSSDDGQN